MNFAQDSNLWLVIWALGLGTFGLRFLFLGLVGDRKMPVWVLRHLRYTAVGLLPGLIAPMVLWPDATGGMLDWPRLIAAIVTLAVGYKTKNIFAAILLGGICLYTIGQMVSAL
ncbi:MAG: AzlD domain-containing protein [Marinovum sp.]|nr:AzlD domain-containing protein [Marinovum sp.]MDG2231276.1 AzlD domain-containing protein [Paracoccaceae bacterium]